MWSIGRFDRLADFFAAARQLGFNQVELNHEISTHMLDGIDLHRESISSIHEPCPVEVSTAALKARDWLISSPREDNRQQGVRAVQRSIDLARELGVPAVVVHAGRVEVDQQLERELWNLYEAGQAHGPAYQALKERLVAARAARAGANLDAVRRSLVELAGYAGRAGVRLGLENRYHYLDIPLPGEMGMLLELVDDGRIGFWYDVGHAQTLDHLGFIPHEEWPRRYAGRILGVHLHDIQGLKDHFAAGLGEMNWAVPAAYLPDHVIRVCEFRSFNTPEQLSGALQFLVGAGCVARV
jgi:sugar phosphate isomerase/epimerase